MAGQNLLKNKWKIFRKRFAHQTRLYLSSRRSVDAKEPVFILSSRRCGSNFLLGLMNSVPGISMASEILHPDMDYGLRERFISKRAVLRHISLSVNARQQRVCGAKLHLMQMEKRGVSVQDLLRIFPRARFIVLYRRSLLEQFVSLKLAETTGVWETTRPQNIPTFVRVEREEFWAFCVKMRGKYANLFRDPRLKKQSLVLDYESLSAAPQEIFDRCIFPWLGMPSSPVSSPFRKQNPDIGNRIENYAEARRLALEELVFQEHAL